MLPYTELNTQNPNTIFKITIYCTKCTNNTKILSKTPDVFESVRTNWTKSKKSNLYFVFCTRSIIHILHFCNFCNFCNFGNFVHFVLMEDRHVALTAQSAVYATWRVCGQYWRKCACVAREAATSTHAALAGTAPYRRQQPRRWPWRTPHLRAWPHCGTKER